MRAKAHQAQRLLVGLLVDQHQVGLHMAIAKAGPLAGEWMIAKTLREWLIIHQRDKHSRQAGFEGTTMPPPRFPSVVAPEFRSAFNRPHSDPQTTPRRYRSGASCPCELPASP